MAETLILLTIGLPWIGALVIRFIKDGQARLLHSLAVIFSLLGGAAAVLLIPYGTVRPSLPLPIGGAFGDFTFAPGGLGV